MTITDKVASLFGIRGGSVREAPPPMPGDTREYVTPKQVSFWPLNDNEHSVVYWGREVGYCGRRPNMPLSFLSDTATKLKRHEKVLIACELMRQVGMPKITPQTQAIIEEARAQVEVRSNDETVDD